MDSGGCTKENTILSLSEDLLKMLDDFQERLDTHFQRSVKGVEPTTQKPQAPNVLDEIIENLVSAKAQLSQQVSFISSDVLPKIN